MKKIKILRIIARLNIGGPAIHTILLTEGLNNSRFESILVTGRPGQREGDMIYLAREKGIQPVIIPELGRSLNIGNDLIAFWKLFCLIKKEKPDIIHTHTAKAGTLGRLAGLLYRLTCNLQPATCNPKLIHTFHGHVLHSYFGRIKTKIFIWIERILAKFTDKIIAVSDNVRQDLITLKITRPEKIITIALGLELRRYLEIEKSTSASAKNYKSIGIVGRLVSIKNHRMFFDTAKKILDALDTGQKMKFLVVGDGPLRNELEQYSQDLGIKNNVTFTGWIRDLAKIYCDLDIAVLTSLNEGTPVALIEAQAAGCPCVATRVGGAQDVVEHGRSGFLIATQNKEQLFKAIMDLLRNPEMIRTMGQYGRERVRHKFSKERLIKDMENLYEQQLSFGKDRQ